MPAPVTPNQFKSGLPSPSGDLCDKFNAQAQEFSYIYQLLAWGMNADGSISDNLKAWIGVASGATIAAPTNLTAVPTATTVVLAWSAVAAATSYDVYRSTSPNPPVVGTTVPLIAGLATNTFTDSAAIASSPAFVPGTAYFYWVVSRNSSAVSILSNVATTVAGTITSPQLFEYGDQIQEFVVPADSLTITITGWGGGGGGGAAYNQGPYGSPTNPWGGNGGGGGSGEKRITVLTGLVTGDIIYVWVGRPMGGGAVGAASAQAGTNGDDTWVQNPSHTEVLRAKGGIGGSGGGAWTPPSGGGTGGAGGAGGTGGTGPDGNTNGSAGAAGTATGGGAGGTAVAGSSNTGGAGGTTAAGQTGAGGYVTIAF